METDKMKKLNKKQRKQLQLDIADQLGENDDYVGYEKKMSNLAKIIKDKNNEIYLKVYDKKAKVLAYFKIEEFNIEPKGETKELSKAFNINLKGGK